MRYRATLSWDGTAWDGFQRQRAGIPTIQGAVEQALQQVTGQAATVLGSGRTDSGVHASGQVIAFDAEWRHGGQALLRALNATLPEDIALQELQGASPRFHPRFDARVRIYEYRVLHAAARQPLLNRCAWHVSGELCLQRMQEAAALLVGVHDFGAFGQAPQGNNTVREIFRSEWRAKPLDFGRTLVYRVEGNAFLTHMVRRMVGMQVAVGRGRLSLAGFAARFHGAQLLGDSPLAPPRGLVLRGVRYGR